MDDNKKQRRDDVRAAGSLQWDEPVGQFEGYVDGDPLVKWLDRSKMPRAGDKLYTRPHADQAEMLQGPAVKTWRERIGVGQDYPLHAPTDVERAMVAEIAELRAGLVCAVERNDELITHQAGKAMDLAEARSEIALASALQREALDVGRRIANWLRGLACAELTPASWRTTCFELAQEWNQVQAQLEPAGAAETCRSRVKAQEEPGHG